MSAPRIESDVHAVWVDETQVHLTSSEFTILERLMARRIMATREIVAHWLYEDRHRDEPGDPDQVVRTLVSHLRRKLREAGCADAIRSSSDSYIFAGWNVGRPFKQPRAGRGRA